MFTGIIEAVGTIRAMEPRGGDVRLQIATGKLDLADVKPGDSIATNGVCLTAVALPGDGFIDFPAILKILRDNGYEGWLVVEAEQDPAKAHPLTYAKLGFSNLTRMALMAGFTVSP